VKLIGDAAKDDAIANVIEAYIGRKTLLTFIVNDMHDLNVLKELVRNNNLVS
jgi:hypothetical protein